MVIEVSKEKVIDTDSAPDYINMMNGIVYSCHEYDEYQEGYRNTIAVNITVGSYMLGLDALSVLEEFINAGLIDPNKDDEYPSDRIKRALFYNESFSWSWMINPETYVKFSKSANSAELPLLFKLVD